MIRGRRARTTEPRFESERWFSTPTSSPPPIPLVSRLTDHIIFPFATPCCDVLDLALHADGGERECPRQTNVQVQSERQVLQPQDHAHHQPCRRKFLREPRAARLHKNILFIGRNLPLLSFPRRQSKPRGRFTAPLLWSSINSSNFNHGTWRP